MLLGFKEQFAPFVEEGSKTHTIRAKRKRRPRVGETCHCYVNPRKKSMRLLGRFECIRVEDLRIETDFYETTIRLCINGEYLSWDETEEFLWRDGFRGTHMSACLQALAFWAKKLAVGPMFSDIIHWKYAPGTKNAKLKSRKPRAGRKTKPRSKN